MPEPQLRKIRVNGVELAYFERNRPQPGAPTLLFVHATGFHGRIWDRVIEPLGDCHTIALEQRGHGRSEKRKIEHWQVVGEDVAAFIEALELSDLIGIGHSMGAHALVDAAAATGAFARLLLLDPTISDPEAYASSTLAFDLPDGIHPAARRFNAFASADDMMERLASKSAFPLYDPQTFRDYCEHGLIPSANGGMTLACPPEIEASVYMASRSNAAIFDAVASVDVPVLVVRAQGAGSRARHHGLRLLPHLAWAREPLSPRPGTALARRDPLHPHAGPRCGDRLGAAGDRGLAAEPWECPADPLDRRSRIMIWLKWILIILGILAAALLAFRAYFLLIGNPRVAAELRDNPQGERAGIVMLLELPDGRELPVNYLREGDQVFVGVDGRWWRVLREGNAPVTMLIRGETLTGKARVVFDDPAYKRAVFDRLRPTAPKWLPEWLDGHLVVIDLDPEETSE